MHFYVLKESVFYWFLSRTIILSRRDFVDFHNKSQNNFFTLT